MVEIKTSISKFMGIAIVAVTISAFIFGTMHLVMKDLSDDVNDYITTSGG
ncbi:hypothetical protein ACTHPV_25225 [Ferdinandcohnia sp. SAFN-114]